jgi:outer membrane protein OmpA-like peptidoglycan-associated protein
MRSLNVPAIILASSAVLAQRAGAEVPAWAQFQAATLVQHYADCLSVSSGPGFGVGQWRTPQWGWQASLLDASIKDKAGSWTARETHVNAGVLYAPWVLAGPLRPFLEGGLGASRLGNPLSLGPSTTTKLNLQGGLGAQYQFQEHGLATLEARVASIRTYDPRTEFQVVLGLGLRWGHDRQPQPAHEEVAVPSPEPAPAPPPLPFPELAPPSPMPSEPLPPRTILLDPPLLAFSLNQAKLTPQAEQGLRQVARDLLAYPGPYLLAITGHTCNLGRPAFNQTLSERRAEAVARVLLQEGVAARHFTTSGLGSSQPKASNATRAGRAQNRRAELALAVPGPSARLPKAVDGQ